MKIKDFFSHIGYSLHSILSHKRRNLSLGAGIVLGAAIFSSIFFYGSLVNTIAVQDIVNEFKYELLNIEPLLYRMAPTAKEIKDKKKNTYVYTTSELINKIKNIRQNIALKLTYQHNTTDMDIAHFLYKIGFITARKTINNKIDRKHYDEKKQLLKSGSIGDGGYNWEIHPSYRSAISTAQKKAWMDTVEFDD